MYQRFINMILNDIVYTLDEAMEKLENIDNYQKKGNDNMIQNNEGSDQQSHQHDIQNCKYFLEHSQQSLEMLKNISIYTVNVLVDESFSERIAQMLNNYLKHFIKGQFMKYRTFINQKMKKYFDYGLMLRDLIIIYAQMGHDEGFIRNVL